MRYFLGLGSNIGERENYLESAKEYLKNHPQIQLIRSSSTITTKPYGVTDQPDFLNCVIEISTKLPAQDLLAFCLETEAKLGRVRTLRWGPRTIDIDIILGEDIINAENLTIPHPEMHKREFVLRSLVELCPDCIHPILNKTINELYLEIKE